MPTKRAGSPSPRKPASAATKRADVSPSAVALYVPNLIGYFRLITGIAALYYAPFTGKQDTRTYFLAFYFVSYMADALDGTAARALNQTSKFGQVLPKIFY
jgi:CDP-diacylglycerol--inositol 3-phosphatidyltransferase